MATQFYDDAETGMASDTRELASRIATSWAEIPPAERDATILGPWDSKPEEAIYSYESEFAQRLLGSRPGDRVNLQEGQVEIVAVAPWRT